jgi:hypothetical protein
MTQRVEQKGGVATGAIDAVEAGDWVIIDKLFNFALSGTFVGTLILERSFDAGATALPITLVDGTVKEFTAPDSAVLEEPESGVLYRVRATAWTSGTANWRFSK